MGILDQAQTRVAGARVTAQTEICMVCRGSGRLPIPLVDKFTGTVRHAHAPCGRCLGAGRVASQ